jgi:hypothetical protein
MPANVRSRSRQPALPKVDLPQVAGKHFVSLRRGIRYHLARSDLTFTKGVVTEISAEDYDWLAEHAVDVLTNNDRQPGRSRKVVRKSQFSPHLDELVEEQYVDAA